MTVPMPMPRTLKALSESNGQVIMVTSQVCFGPQPRLTVESFTQPAFWTGVLATHLWDIRSLRN